MLVLQFLVGLMVAAVVLPLAVLLAWPVAVAWGFLVEQVDRLFRKE